MVKIEVDDSVLTQVMITDIEFLYQDILFLEESKSLSGHWETKNDLVDLKRYFKNILLALEYYMPMTEYRELLKKYKDYQ